MASSRHENKFGPLDSFLSKMTQRSSSLSEIAFTEFSKSWQ